VLVGSAAQELQAKLSAAAAAAAAAAGRSKADAPARGGGGFLGMAGINLQALAATVLGNLQLRLTNVHVR
jgi:vacuolar protein sorting-associated protein 13A/C